MCLPDSATSLAHLGPRAPTCHLLINATSCLCTRLQIPATQPLLPPCYHLHHLSIHYNLDRVVRTKAPALCSTSPPPVHSCYKALHHCGPGGCAHHHCFLPLLLFMHTPTWAGVFHSTEHCALHCFTRKNLRCCVYAACTAVASALPTRLQACLLPAA